jgi:hypothetical protein
MVYNDMPIIIPLLATGYLFTIYLLLMLAQWTMKSSRYAANSLSDVYAPSLPSEQALSKKEVEWSLRVRDAVLLSKRDGVSRELMPTELRTENINIVTASSSTADS